MKTQPDFTEYVHSGNEGDCPSCGAVWQPAPAVGRGAREMVHSNECEYIIWLNAE